MSITPKTFSDLSSPHEAQAAFELLADHFPKGVLTVTKISVRQLASGNGSKITRTVRYEAKGKPWSLSVELVSGALTVVLTHVVKEKCVFNLSSAGKLHVETFDNVFSQDASITDMVSLVIKTADDYVVWK